MKDRRFTSKKELLILALIIAALFFLWFFWQSQPPSNYLRAEVYQNERLVYSLPLDVPVTVSMSEHPHVQIQVKNQSAGFIHSDCPDHICINTGFLNKAGQSAACLPNGVILLIKSQEEDGVDITA